MRQRCVELPMLPLRGMLVFPHMIIHLDVGRAKSINSVEAALEKHENLLFLVMQKDSQNDNPTENEVYRVGTVAKIRQSLKLPGGTIRILIECLYRAELVSVEEEAPFWFARICQPNIISGHNKLETEALMRSLLSGFEEYAQNDKRISPETISALGNMSNPEQFVDIMVTHINLKLIDKQEILEEFSVEERMRKLFSMLSKEIDIIALERKIAAKVREQIEKSQKEYYLREQIKAIQDELGEKDDRSHEVAEFRKKMSEIRIPKNVEKQLNAELDRLGRMPVHNSEAVVIRTYIDWVLDLPWLAESKDSKDIKRAEKILNEEHYGLEKAKERILEYLSVRQLSKNVKGPIICFTGPPGVGKTSLARSVAHALGREFVRVSLGGVRDEAEIRGHRRTYIGAMPGRIIQSMKIAGKRNPVFLLDEIDKLGNDYKGDPSSALLEALDPEQNANFSDHYIEMPFDLSKVIFITTANNQHSIPRPLLDRMEIIELSSYTEDEKLHIAQDFLMPKQLKEHALDVKKVSISEAAMRMIIRQYCREAGVRELERKIAKIMRQISRVIVGGEKGDFQITKLNLSKFLGMPRYHYGKAEINPQIGLVMGLAWTEAGGDLLTVEVKAVPGKGNTLITGQLGDVMKESAQAGLTYIRAIGTELGISVKTEEIDLHIHIPEGAIPKDGPSAGITMATAIASELSSRKVRSDLAMTGEITLRGRVLAVGGIKEKVLAAHRGGCHEVIMPLENKKDLEDVPAYIKKQMRFHFVSSMREVLEIALLPLEAEDAAIPV